MHDGDDDPETGARETDAKEPLFPPSPPRGESRLLSSGRDREDDGTAQSLERLWRDPGRRRLDQQSMSVRERLEEALATNIAETSLTPTPTPTPTRKSSAEAVERASRTPSIKTTGTGPDDAREGGSRIMVRKPNTDLLVAEKTHKRRSSRASWTGFNFWGPAKPVKEDPASRSRSGSVKRNEIIFEPAATAPIVASHTDPAHARTFGDQPAEDGSFRYGDGGSTPSFRAIVHATRILTADPTSIIRPKGGGLLVGHDHRSRVERMAQELVERAKREGVGVRTRRGSGKDDDKRPEGGARKALLRTLSSIPVEENATPTRGTRSSSIASALDTGRRRSRTTTTIGSNSTPKSPSPGPAPLHAVQMEPMMDPSERPPPMLVRRATADDFLPNDVHLPSKSSRFGEVSELEPYIDRYGFVYHLKYVQMLLDLQQGMADVEEPEEAISMQHSLTTTPGKVTVGRHRSATIATFSPSPGKPTLSSAEQVATVPAGSIRLRKAKLDQLASKYRKPLASLLGQLAEMHDKQEQERMKKWHQFLKYRRQKLPSVAGQFEDVIGVANLGDGKIGRDLMKRFIHLVHTMGIPIALRASVWAECSGAKEAFTPGEYQEILAVHQGDEHPTLVEIEKDVKRTFPTNVFFGGDGVGCEKLRRCLSAYAWRDPQIGYCQGMNLIAATLLLTYDDEEQAYWTFVSIIKNMLPDDWFTSSLQGSMIEQAVIGDLVESLLPEVAAHLQDLGVELSAITFGWILSLFANCLPIETLLRIWDCFMVEGRDVIPCTVIAILKLGEQGILGCDNVGELFEYLNTITERLWTADKLVLLQEQFKSSITSTELDRRRKEHLEALTDGR
ncbi:hypothetical protein NliqN6_2310 [Naganishia liquefaciens]|uniref:Rab-GAP TBC domain-containing protein n=1 Tax=Naganishia liquefaciens TaxID=104408 RepID=A0A8H3TS54_9TREE|nr:hypothetical protein NliqN6_2310 [Naganishia liquefaciens]